MKKMKPFLSSIAILAIVGSGLAFKNASFFGQGTVYCLATCPTKIDYTPDNNGVITKVCGTDISGHEITEYVKIGAACVALAPGQKYSITAAGK